VKKEIVRKKIEKTQERWKLVYLYIKTHTLSLHQGVTLTLNRINDMKVQYSFLFHIVFNGVLYVFCLSRFHQYSYPFFFFFFFFFTSLPFFTFLFLVPILLYFTRYFYCFDPPNARCTMTSFKAAKKFF
jgi:hypothetical protein